MARAGEIVTRDVGERSYGFRTPNLYDPAKARRILSRQGVRRPATEEMRVCALAGIAAIAKSAGDEEEGRRQQRLLEQWYSSLTPIAEDDIDEPDPFKRGERLVRLQTERVEEQRRLYADVIAIEATLERHWPPYAELVADRAYWDDVSRIEIVRLLLVERDGEALPRDGDGMLTEDAYRSLPDDHKVALATCAFRLLAPDEAQRKN